MPKFQSKFEVVYFSFDLLGSPKCLTPLLPLQSFVDDLFIVLSDDDNISSLADLKEFVPLASEYFASLFSCTLSIICWRSFSEDEFNLFSPGIIPDDVLYPGTSAEFLHLVDGILRRSIHCYLFLLSKCQLYKQMHSSGRNKPNSPFDISEFEKLAFDFDKLAFSSPKQPTLDIEVIGNYFTLSDILDLFLLGFDSNYAILKNIVHMRVKLFPSLCDKDPLDFLFVIESLIGKLQPQPSSHDQILKIVADLKAVNLLLSLYPSICSSHDHISSVFRLLTIAFSFDSFSYFNNLFRSHIYLLTLILLSFTFGVSECIDPTALKLCPNTDCSDPLFSSLKPVLKPLLSSPKKLTDNDKGISFLIENMPKLADWITCIENTKFISLVHDSVGKEIFGHIRSQNTSSDDHETILLNFLVIFPDVQRDVIQQILETFDWNPENAYEALVNMNNNNTNSIPLDSIRVSNICTNNSYLGNDIDEILKNKIKVIVSLKSSAEHDDDYYEQNELEAFASPVLDGSADNPDDEAEEDNLETQLKLEFIKDSSVFYRKARNSEKRKIVKEKYNISDEKIEGWARMNVTSFNPAALSTDQQSQYVSSDVALLWKGNKPCTSDHIQDVNSETPPQPKTPNKKYFTTKKSHHRKDKALSKHLKSTGSF